MQLNLSILRSTRELSVVLKRKSFIFFASDGMVGIFEVILKFLTPISGIFLPEIYRTCHN